MSGFTKNINAAANSDFLSAFIRAAAGTNEANSLVTKNGTLSAEGMARIQNALFELAYHDQTLTEQFSEGDESPLRNVIRAMMNVAPVAAQISEGIKAGDFYGVDFAEDIVEAEKFLKDLKQNPKYENETRKAAEHYELYPGTMLGAVPDYLKKLEIAMDENIRSGRNLSYLLNRVLKGVKNMGDPNQTDMFGGMYDLSTEEAVNAQKEKIVDRAIKATEEWKAQRAEEAKRYSTREYTAEEAQRIVDDINEKRKEAANLRREISELQSDGEYRRLYNDMLFIDPATDEFSEAAKQLRAYSDKIGLTEKAERAKAFEEELRKNRSELEDAEKVIASNKEQNAVRESGLSEADYFRKQALKEFGTTPYFYDAGYILPDGKMLNLSGEKGRHFGSRGQDHRAVGTIYEATTGSEAMLRFMSDGNIRIMAESPGLDIISTVAPTTAQYSKIRDFIRQYAKEEYFNIDFTDERGNTVDNLEYEGNISPTRIINDIKAYYETGEANAESLVSQFHRRYSSKEDNTASEYFEKDKYFDRQVDKWEELKSGTKVKVGILNEGSALNKTGFPASGMWFDVDKIKKSMEDHDDHLTKSILKQIPDLLNDPIAIAEYKGKNGEVNNTVTVYGITLPNGKTPVAVGVMMVKGVGSGLIINKIRTVHADNHARITDENILYLNEDKKRTQTWFQVVGINVPLNATKFGLIRSIKYKDKSVNPEIRRSSRDAAYMPLAEKYRDGTATITASMTDSERASILKDKFITAADYRGQSNDRIANERENLDSGKVGLVKKALTRAAQEFGLPKSLVNDDTNMTVVVSIGSLKESAGKQIDNAEQLIKLLPVLDEAVAGAIGIEAHNIRYYADYNTVLFVNLLGGHYEGSMLTPVRFGVKVDNQGKATLYVVISDKQINKAEVVKSPTPGKPGENDSRSASGINIPQLAGKINTPDIVKYLPDEFLSNSQKKIKNKAIAETVKYTNDKNDRKYVEYIQNGDWRSVKRMVEAAAKANGYNIRAYHGTTALFTVFRKGDIGYHVGSLEQAEDRVRGLESARIMPLFVKANNLLEIGMDYGNWGGSNVALMLLETEVFEDDPDIEDKLRKILKIDRAKGKETTSQRQNRALRELLQSLGYDGIVYENAFEGHSKLHSGDNKSYILFDPSQLKSADPVTYDDNGDIIPLSERFRTDRTGEDAWKNEDIRHSTRNGAYDFSKSFAEQVDDYDSGVFPAKDSLIMGQTPKVFTDLKLLPLPLTYDQGHAKEAIENLDGDHLGKDLLKEVPKALEDPIAIIDSATVPGRIVAIVELPNRAKKTVAAVEIDGHGWAHKKWIDSNAVVSAYEKKNAITKLLKDAVDSELSGKGGIYYWQQKKAIKIATSLGVQFPGASAIPDGLVRTILDQKSNVKPKIASITKTKQFDRWFRKSKIVNENGNPLIVYHGTDSDFTEFDPSKGRANMDIQGMFFSPWEIDAAGYGKKVGAYYLSIQNPAPEGVAYKALNKFKGQNNAGVKARQYLESLGYDGVNNNDEEFIAFYPWQIKSATDNIGTFDRENDDTLFSSRADSDIALWNPPDVDTRGIYKAVKNGSGKVDGRFDVTVDTGNNGFNVTIKDTQTGETYKDGATVEAGENAEAFAERYTAAMIRNIKSGRPESTSRSTAGIYIKKGENPVRDVNIPVFDVNGDKVRRFMRTVEESGAIPDDMVDDIKKDIMAGGESYKPISNKSALAAFQQNGKRRPRSKLPGVLIRFSAETAPLPSSACRAR